MGPFIRNDFDTKKLMRNLVISLIPIIVFAIYKNGIKPFFQGEFGFIKAVYPIIFILIGMSTTFFTELLYCKIIKKEKFKKDFYGIFPGLFLALISPLNTPIWVLVLGCIIASLSKNIVGGLGQNKLNPTLVGYIVVLIFTNNFFLSSNIDYQEINAASSLTPLVNFTAISDIGSYEQLVKPYGNLLNFFLGNIPGFLAETGCLLCILAFLFLTFTKSIKWRITLSYILTVFVITFGIGRLLDQGIYYPLFHIMSGGLFFGTVFIATDPVTSCVTPIGQILQGIFLGVLTVAFRFIGIESLGLSILIINIFVFLLDKIGAASRFDFMKLLPTIVITCIIVCGTIIWAASTKRLQNNDETKLTSINQNSIQLDLNKLII